MSRALPSTPDLVQTPSTIGLVDRFTFPEFEGPPLDGDAAPPPPAPAVQARLGLRLLAKLIDGALAGVIYCVATFFVEDWLTGFLLGGVLAAAFFLFSDALTANGRSRRSPGKRIVGLTLSRLDRLPVDWRTSARRNAVLIAPFFVQAFTFDAPVLSWLILLAAVAVVGREVYMAATDVYGCRWGDEFADTEVLERAPVPVRRRAARPLGH